MTTAIAKGKVQIGCVDGLIPSDELYLWGILGLALAGKDPSNEFYATPYWILRQLGRVSATKKGSKGVQTLSRKHSPPGWSAIPQYRIL